MLIDLESSDEHFSDASEGQGHARNFSTSSVPNSPIPVTRVERVDDNPSHGEVPGTAAYSLRTQDAVPDEVEIVPEGQRSRSSSRLSGADRPSTPGGTPVPRTIVEKVEPDKPSHGEVPGTAAYNMRTADAEPDEVITSPQKTRAPLEGEFNIPTSAGHALTREGIPTANHRSRSRSSSNGRTPTGEQMSGDASLKSPELQETAAVDGGVEFQDEVFPEHDVEDSLGDDFDDFEEGDVLEDDFGDFGEANDVEESVAEPEAQPAPVVDPLAHLVSSTYPYKEYPLSIDDLTCLLSRI